MTVQAEFLKIIPYFSGLSDIELEAVSALMFEKTAERGEVIALEDEPADALYFVKSGVVKVLKTSSAGKEQILNIVRPGESFNDVPIFDSGLNPTTAQAMGNVELYGIRKKEIGDILQDYPQVATNIIEFLASRLRQLVSLVEDLSLRRVLGRVAKILLENAGDKTSPKPKLTQQDMAAMAGTAREVVSRSLKTMEEEGAIRIDRHRVIITDKEVLEEIADASFETKVTD